MQKKKISVRDITRKEGLCLPVLHGGHRGGGSLSLPTPGLRPARLEPSARVTPDSRQTPGAGELRGKSGMPLLLIGLDTASDAPAYLPLAQAVHVVEPRVGWGRVCSPGRLCKSQAVKPRTLNSGHISGGGGGDDRDYMI